MPAFCANDPPVPIWPNSSVHASSLVVVPHDDDDNGSGNTFWLRAVSLFSTPFSLFFTILSLVVWLALVVIPRRHSEESLREYRDAWGKAIDTDLLFFPILARLHQRFYFGHRDSPCNYFRLQMILLPLRLFGVFAPDLQKLPSPSLRTFPHFFFFVAAAAESIYLSSVFSRAWGV